MLKQHLLEAIKKYHKKKGSFRKFFSNSSTHMNKLIRLTQTIDKPHLNDEQMKELDAILYSHASMKDLTGTIFHDLRMKTSISKTNRKNREKDINQHITAN